MTVLTNSARAKVLENVLTESFAPRFKAVFKKMEADALKQRNEKYPHYVAALSNADIRPFLKGQLLAQATIDDIKVCRPKYGQSVSRPRYAGWGYNNDTFAPKFTVDVVLPNGDSVKIYDEEIIKEYSAAWADYSTSRSLLGDTLYSYNSSEKFEVDFP